MTKATEITETTVDKEIGAKIELHRKLRSKTRHWLGEEIGRSYQQVQNYETGHNRVSASMLVLIATRLNYPITNFFPDKE
jgi:transcriptional regulator with XRE-family HTH domain